MFRVRDGSQERIRQESGEVANGGSWCWDEGSLPGAKHEPFGGEKGSDGGSEGEVEALVNAPRRGRQLSMIQALVRTDKRNGGANLTGCH